MVEEQCIERRVLRSEFIPRQHSFGDTNVVLRRVDDADGYWRADEVGYSQGENTPIQLWVGIRASDQQLQRVCDRLRVSFEDARAFRDTGRG